MYGLKLSGNESLPRASGGVSTIPQKIYTPLFVFPAQAGVFPEKDPEALIVVPVFPAQAGVFPQGLHEAPEGFGLPRASGGVSDGTTPVAAFGVVFPAQAGVFL